MSMVASSSAITNAGAGIRSSKPSFFGLVRGELFKINRQWATWIMLILFMGVMFLPYLIMFIESDIKSVVTAPDGGYFYGRVSAGLALIRIFGGFFMIILTARTIGQEYQLGTIRIVLGRGVGRVQLLLAKLATMVIWTCILVIIGLVLNILLAGAQVLIVTGNLNVITGLSSTVWGNMGTFVLTILVSMGASILMAAAITVLFRSLAGGLSASLAWFPADNIIVIILAIAFEVTKSTFWENISLYLLGPNLNIMAGDVAKVHSRAWMLGQAPLLDVDGTHTLVVAAVFAVIFFAAAIVLTWKRDVKE